MEVKLWGWFPPTELGDFYARACSGDKDAEVFLLLWIDIVHRIDDQIDDGITAPEFLLRTLASMNLLYTTSFYQRNSAYLSMAVILITNTYADSVAGERSAQEPDRVMADVLRFCGNDMVCAVAFLTGGWNLMREISMKLRRLSWTSHHEAEAAEHASPPRCEPRTTNP